MYSSVSHRQFNDSSKEEISQSALSPMHFGLVVGLSVTFILLAAALFLFLLRWYCRHGYLNRCYGLSAKSAAVNDSTNFNLNDLTPAFSNGKLSSSSLYNVVTNDDIQRESEKELNLRNSNEKLSKEKCNAFQWSSRRDARENRRNSLSSTGSAICLFLKDKIV